MKAILLAAGKGKRLEPITNFLPKSMIKICGKPLLEYIIDELSKFGFNDICIVVGHESNQIISYFNSLNKLDVKISFITQNEFKGTGHATLCAKNFVGNDQFLLYLSDTLIPFDLKNFLSEIKNNKYDISILSSKVFLNDLTSVGNIMVENDYVKQISEKTTSPKSSLAWAGVAFFQDNSIFNFIEKLTLSTNNEYDITEAMNLALKENKIIKNHSCKKFIDCGTIKGLVDGLKFILDNVCNSTKKPLIKSKMPSYVGMNCLFGKNVIIGPYVSIENNVIVGDNVKISESLVLDNVVIPSNKSINKSILSSYGEISQE